MQRVVYVDVDETICITPDNPRDYYSSTPIIENIQKINRLFENGDKIVYWTARGSRSGINWHDLTQKQLDSWGAKYHELKCNKPYYDVFIDDKAFHIEDVQ